MLVSLTVNLALSPGIAAHLPDTATWPSVPSSSARYCTSTVLPFFSSRLTTEPRSGKAKFAGNCGTFVDVLLIKAPLTVWVNGISPVFKKEDPSSAVPLMWIIFAYRLVLPAIKSPGSASSSLSGTTAGLPFNPTLPEAFEAVALMLIVDNPEFR